MAEKSNSSTAISEVKSLRSLAEKSTNFKVKGPSPSFQSSTTCLPSVKLAAKTSSPRLGSMVRLHPRHCKWNSPVRLMEQFYFYWLDLTGYCYNIYIYIYIYICIYLYIYLSIYIYICILYIISICICICISWSISYVSYMHLSQPLTMSGMQYGSSGWGSPGSHRPIFSLVGGFNPCEKYESQLGWLFPYIIWKIKHVWNQPVFNERTDFREMSNWKRVM